MVNPMANSVEDYLIDGLSLKLNRGASYAADRRKHPYFPADSIMCQASSGARVSRVSEGW